MPVAAIYNDGREARDHPVTLAFDGTDLVITFEGGPVADHWPAAEVHLTERPGHGRPVRLRRGHDGAERLTLADAADLRHLTPHCPALMRTAPSGWRRWRPVLLWGSAAVASVVLLFTVLIPVLAGRIAAAIPASLEAEIGERVERQIIGLLGVVDDGKTVAVCTGAAGQAALDGLVSRLSAPLGVSPIHVVVVNSGIVNAFALPGRRIVVLRGLIDDAVNSTELAGVLAHEIGHLDRRHPTRVTIENAGSALLVGLLLGDVTGGTVIAGVGKMLIGGAYSRDAEREADAIGIELMIGLGLDPAELADFLERITEKHGDLPRSLSLLSTHPPTAERVDRIRAEPRPPGAGWPLTEAEWAAVREMCRR